jgi:hypothetical protein
MIKISYYDFKLLSDLSKEFNLGFDKFNKYYEEFIRLKKMDNYSDYQTDIYKTTSKALRMLTSYTNANASHRRTAIRKQRIEAFEENKASFIDDMMKTTIHGSKKLEDDIQDFISEYRIDYDKTDVRLKKIYSSGIQVVIINDYNNSFYPVLSINLSSFQYKMQDELDKKVGETILKGMVSYYNA